MQFIVLILAVGLIGYVATHCLGLGTDKAFGQMAWHSPCPPCPNEYRYRPQSEEEWNEPRGPRQETARIEGDIDGETLERFRPAAIVILNSPGGEIAPAIRIAEMIRSSGSTAVIPDGAECLSACAIIWIAAEHRKIAHHGRVGFHAPHTGRGEPAPEAEAAIARAYQRWGMSDDFIRWSMHADPDDMAYLTRQLAQRFALRVNDEVPQETIARRPSSISLDDISARLERLEQLVSKLSRGS